CSSRTTENRGCIVGRSVFLVGVFIWDQYGCSGYNGRHVNYRTMPLHIHNRPVRHRMCQV
ncbi:hypothetical protein PISMIDRAFT_684909, partial [Pisolithus microcarpus 441]